MIRKSVVLQQFFYIFFPDPHGTQMTDRLYNLLQSLPNDDDVNQIYQEDKKIYLKTKHDKMKRATLELLFKCLWDGHVLLKLSTSVNPANISASTSQGVPSSGEWEKYYVVLQKHRITWWISEDDISDGQRECAGQLLLGGKGVSGVTQTSPVDIKDMKDKTRLLAIFGYDEHGLPLKCTIFFDDMNQCKQFEKLINIIQ